jgi:protein SCO1
MSIRSSPSEPPSEERHVFWMLIGFSLFFCAGYGLFLLALTHHQDAPEAALDDSEPLVIAPDHPRQLIDFSLTDQDGRTVTRADLDGKFLVVSFLFTSCSLTCPVVSQQMEAIQQRTTNQPDLKLISLTVDPDDDTVPVLAKYSKRFSANSNCWLFLTGDNVVIHQLIGASFLSSDTNNAFSYMPGNFANIERIALVDPQGRVRNYFDGLDNDVPDAVIDEIKQLKQ